MHAIGAARLGLSTALVAPIGEHGGRDRGRAAPSGRCDDRCDETGRARFRLPHFSPLPKVLLWPA